MNYLSENTISNKTVLLRCDFNVPVKDNVIEDNSKIIKSLDTIKYLLDNNNKVIIFSHFGRVKTDSDKINNSLRIVFEELKKYIDVSFIEDPNNIILDDSKCFLVENTRFTDLPEVRESKNDLELSKYWASFGDVFVNDAFASLHRAHSSTAGLSKFLPTYFGFLVESELKNLDILINNTPRPFVVIMGGAKVEDKIVYIEGLCKYVDKIILTGSILNAFLKVMNYNIGKSDIDIDEVTVERIKKVLSDYSDKICFGRKFGVLNNDKYSIKDLDLVNDIDILYDNYVLYDALDNCNILFMNGTCGFMKDDRFTHGTKELLEYISNLNCKKIAGGGDALYTINRFGFNNIFDYLSSGGGATLEYVSNHKLNALEFIKENTSK